MIYRSENIQNYADGSCYNESRILLFIFEHALNNYYISLLDSAIINIFWFFLL